MIRFPELPVLSALPDLRTALADHRSTVLLAPPGAGKTTVIPLALMDEPWLSDGKIVMLEPRRLATRGAAWRMADLLGERPGETVGYRMRGESKAGPRSTIEVVTEGILTRMLQSDPSLDGIGLLIFDEFHERNLHADLGLALALQSRELFRPDLRILIMSATLSAEPVARLLNDAPIVESEGRMFPVETRYAGRDTSLRLERDVAGVIARALRETDEGDLLVFLPGFGEIKRTEERLEEGLDGNRFEIHPLHGSLPKEAQERALQPSPANKRKIVLATSIAETSLTIEGVRVVVDSGLSRVPAYSPASGMTTLETVPVSLASADQRRGRAGRVAPGVCYRMWNEAENVALRPDISPEILEADLAPLALDLARWGASPEDLRWIDPPPAGAYAAALELLRDLDALDSENHLTSHGERMAGLPTHPRLAHLILTATRFNLTDRACLIAGFIEGRDIVRGDAGRSDPDIHLRLEALERLRSGDRGTLSSQLDRNGARIALEASKRLRGIAESAISNIDSDSEEEGSFVSGDPTGPLLALAYPDRIAQRRPGGGESYNLSNGRRARLRGIGPLSNEAYLVAASVSGSGREGTIDVATPISLEQLRMLFAPHIRMKERVVWDSDSGSVSAHREEVLGALTISSVAIDRPDDDLIVGAILEGIRTGGLGPLPWTRDLNDFRARATFLHRRHDSSWPDMSDAGLLASLDRWLRPALEERSGRNRLKGLDLKRALINLLDWEQARDIDRLAPERLEVPSGSNIRLDYSNPDEPVLPVRLQEMFGATETPRIGGGRIPVTLHLLSPAQRPVQVTQDLAGFWERTYTEVRKELKGRYPKHYWPDDPHQAEPTRRVRPRG